MNNFDDVTLLITHYNRSKSLGSLLGEFRDLNCRFADIVVSDDGSKEEHLSFLRSLQDEFNFNLITTPVNKGLGNNINKGQDAVKTKYTLYVQEDFVPQSLFPEKLGKGLEFMEERDDLDIVRFYAYTLYPYLRPYKDGFSEMNFSLWAPGYRKFHYYSDHPHLRRSNFFERFGRYPEGLNPEHTEYKMAISVLKNKGKSLFFDKHKSLFDHRNSSEEPSTMKRNIWRQSNNPFISFLRVSYRHAKWNFNYLF